MSDDQKQLADGILAEAQAEAQKVRSEWETSRESRRASLEQRIAQLDADATARVQRETKRIESQTDAQISMEERRAELKLRDSVYRAVEEGAANRIANLAADPSYAAILKGWIREACVGLGAERSTIASSAQEKEIVARVLDEAVNEASEITGRRMTVTLSDAPLADQGVVLTAQDGKTGFSNRVRDRIRRRRGAIRRIVYDRLFGDTRNAGTDRRTN